MAGFVDRMADQQEFTDPQRPRHREHRLRTPSGELSHEARLRRQRTHINVFTLVLIAVLAMLVYAAAFDLDHWAEWAVFGGICATAIGFMIAVHSR